MFIKGAAVLLLLVIVTSHALNQCCTQQGVNFTAEPETKVSCEGGEVSFSCTHNRIGIIPHWNINHTLYYYSSNFPANHIRQNDGELIVSNIDSSQNGTPYQCQLELSDNSDDGSCLCDSSEGYLIVVHCGAPSSVQCLPIKHSNGTLTGIFVNFTETEGIETDYNVTVTDSITGGDCGFSVITTSSCRGGTCNCEFNIPSHCINSSALNVTVSTTAYSAVTEPITIDTFNKFVSVAIHKSDSGVNYYHISCTFSGEPTQSEKRCAFRHGPKTNNCENLPFPAEITLAGTTSMEIADIDLTYLGENPRVCIALEAFSGKKSWTVIGIFDTETGQPIIIDDTISTSPPNTVTPSINGHNKSSTGMPVFSINVYGLVLLVVCILIKFS